MTNRHLLRLIKADTAANEAAGMAEFEMTTPADHARFAMALRVAEGTGRNVRAAVWELCAEALRRRAAAG